jgi:uncharacterized protein YbjT (DUF2867 family)
MNILVTAAHGRTGRAVVQALAARGAQVTALIRDPAQAEAVRTAGAAATAIGDFGDADSLRKAAAGVPSVVHIGPPMHPLEVNFTANVLAAARAAGAERLIYYSVLHPLRREIRHHRLKLEAEEQIVESGFPFTILQPSRYMQHLAPIWREVTERGVHAMPFSVDQPLSVVDLEDLAEATAICALDPAHAYATYELAGPEALTQRQMAEILSAKLGRAVTARAIPFDELESKARASGASDDRVGQMLIMNRHYDQHGMVGNPNVLRWLLGREPNRYAAFVDRMIAQQGGGAAKPQTATAPAS